MSILEINKTFRKLAVFQLKHKALCLSLIAVFTFVGFLGLPKLKVTNDDSTWYSSEKGLKESQKRFNEHFSSSDRVMILLTARDVFEKEVLEAIERLCERLKDEVPLAKSVISLTNLSLALGNEDRIEIINPFEEGIGTPEEIAEKKALIMSREALVNTLVSDDAKETWIILSLSPYSEENADEEKHAVATAARKIVESEEFKSPSFTMKATGGAYTKSEESEVILKETTLRITVGAAIMLVCLIVLLPSLRGILTPLIATVSGIAVVLGYSAHFGIKADLNMISLPVMLGMALAIGYSVHYINAFKLEFRNTGKRKESVITALEETAWPIFFTVITTVASLLSLISVKLEPLTWTGAMSAAVVTSVYIYVVGLLPIFYSFGKDAASKNAAAKADKKLEREIKREARNKKINDAVDSLFAAFGKKVIKYRFLILLFGLIIAVLSCVGLSKLKVNMDFTAVLGEKIPYVKRLMDIMSSKLGSHYSYSVMIEGEKDFFRSPSALKALDECASSYGKFRLTKVSGGKARVSSAADVVKEMNRTLNADKASFYRIPEEEDVLSSLLFMAELNGADLLFSELSEDYSAAFIRVELKKYDASLIEREITEAKKIASSLFPDAKVSVVGEVAAMAMMNKKLVVGELTSFGWSFVMIAIMLSLAFSSIRTGLIAMIPNVAPVLLVGGVMGFLRYPLDMLTMTVMPMILGIAVDDTIHFTNHVKFEHELGDDYDHAVVNSFRKIGRSMFSSSIILCLMFTVYIFSPLSMLHRIGLLSFIGIASALVADYTVTPALIYMSKPFKSKNKGGK